MRSEPGDQEAEALAQLLVGLPIHRQRDQLDLLENTNPDLLNRVRSVMERYRKEAGS